MSAKQPEPNPFSREGSEPDDGLGSGPNRFDTCADGSTPLGQPAPNSSADGQSPAADPSHTAASAPHSTDPTSAGSAVFPQYGSADGSGYADPEPNDEAYAAFRGYQAGGYGHPAPPSQLYQGYPDYPSYSQPGVYGRPYGAFGPRLPNSPYAVPALVLGIVGVFCAITGPVGLGLGIAAIKQIDAEPQQYAGRGLAIGGIATGAIGTLWILLYLLAALA